VSDYYQLRFRELIISYLLELGINRSHCFN